MRKIFPLLLLFVAFSVIGCVSSRNAKKGAKLLASGQYEQAAEAYMVSLAADKTNAEAISGLKSSGQRAIDEKAIQVIRAQEGEDHKTAVTKFVEIREFVAKASALGVTLLISDMATTSYNESKPIYLEKIYGEAQLLMESEKFAEAEVILNEINRIEPNYGEVNDMLVIAKCEPIYRKAQQNYNSGLYRSSYTSYAMLVNDFGGYKDAADLMTDALTKAILTIKVDNFTAKQGNVAFASTLKSGIINSINTKKNIFVKVVDSKSAERLIEEQRQAQSMGADVELGKMLAPKAILSANVSEYNVVTGKPVKEEKRGYLERVIKEKNAAGVITDITVFDKVVYVINRVKNEVNVTLTYQVTSIETGEVMITDKVNSKKVDNVEYVEFNGNIKDLIPGYWEYPNKPSAKDYKSDKVSEINELHKMSTKKREPASAEKLLGEVTEDIISDVATRINSYNPEKK